MWIKDKFDKLYQEAQALKFFHNLEDTELKTHLTEFDAAWHTNAAVTPEQLTALINKIDDRIERLCIDNRIVDEDLEFSMEVNKGYTTVLL